MAAYVSKDRIKRTLQAGDLARRDGLYALNDREVAVLYEIPYFQVIAVREAIEEERAK